MERRWFTDGVRTDFAASPADVVVFRHNGWQECGAPADADTETATDETKDDLPDGNPTDDQ